MKDAANCRHEKFKALIKAQRIQQPDGVVHYVQVSTIKCEECNTDFVYPNGETTHSMVITPSKPSLRRKLSLVASSVADAFSGKEDGAVVAGAKNEDVKPLA